MNERYGPQILRMGAIIALLVGIGIALVLYMEGQGSSHLEKEQARADKLGWIVPAGQPKPTITPEESGVLEAENQAAMSMGENGITSLLERSETIPDSKLISGTDRAATILREARSKFRALREPIMGLDFVDSARTNLVAAMALRAEALARSGDMVGASDALQSAAAISNVFAGANSRENLAMDARVRTAWCRVAMRHPSLELVPELSNLLGYERVVFRRRVNESYAPSYGREIKEGRNRRQEFDRLRMANQLVEQNDAKSKDLLECWTYLRDGIRLYSFDRLQSHMPGISSMLKAQLVRNQIPKLFAEALQSPGVEPASLAQSKDPYNNLKPLKFRTIKGGFAIYSVGDDAADGKANALDFGVKVVNGRVLSNLSGERFGPWQ